MLIPPAYRDCVCFVYGTFGGVLKPVGTAFFLAYTIPPVRFMTVVTALHVVANAQSQSDDGKTLLRVNTKDGGFRFVEVEAEKWFKPHVSEEIIDVAFCQWDALPGASDFDFLSIGSELAATADVIKVEEIGVGNEVAFTGLFVRHQGKLRNEPIMRFGNICAMPTEPVSTAVGEIDAYLVESRSVGGLSGSPMFVDVGLLRVAGNTRQYRRGDGPVLYLLGVVNAHWNASARSPQIDGDLSTEVVNMGVAVVTPIDKVFQVIAQSTYGRAVAAFAKKFADSPPTLADLDENGQFKMELKLPPVGDDAKQ